MKKWLKITLGIVALLLVIVTMVYAYRSQMTTEMESPEIIIRIDGEPLIMKEEIEEFLRTRQLFYPKMKFEQINFEQIETELKSMSEILDVKVYARIGSKWVVDIRQRKPIVRIFNKFGETFYIDALGSIVESNVYHTSRALVASGNISDKATIKTLDSIINNDSLKTIHSLDDIYRISNYVCNDPFLTAQVSQVYLREDGDFILIPQIGDHIIVFGTADSDEEVNSKFTKLITFYKEGIIFEGWNKYSEINLKYRDQIVCKKK